MNNSEQLKQALQLGTKPYYEDFAPLENTLSPGSMPADSFYHQWIRETKPQIAIEVGSFLGYSAVHMAQEMKTQCPDGLLICIDTWLGSPEHYDMLKIDGDPRLGYKNGYPTMFYKFISNVIHADCHKIIHPLPYPSSTGAVVLNKIFTKLQIDGADFIYLDGSHEEDDVLLDLHHYIPLLKKGGVMTGDDWGWNGVRNAVQSYTSENNLKLMVYPNEVHWKISL